MCILIKVFPCPLCGASPTVNKDKDGIPIAVYCECDGEFHSYTHWQKIAKYAYELQLRSK